MDKDEIMTVTYDEEIKGKGIQCNVLMKARKSMIIL
jgi:hypothetical protein